MPTDLAAFFKEFVDFTWTQKAQWDGRELTAYAVLFLAHEIRLLREGRCEIPKEENIKPQGPPNEVVSKAGEVREKRPPTSPEFGAFAFCLDGKKGARISLSREKWEGIATAITALISIRDHAMTGANFGDTAMELVKVIQKLRWD